MIHFPQADYFKGRQGRTCYRGPLMETGEKHSARETREHYMALWGTEVLILLVRQILLRPKEKSTPPMIKISRDVGAKGVSR